MVVAINGYEVMIEQKQTKLAIFVLRWLIFAGPVTYMKALILRLNCGI